MSSRRPGCCLCLIFLVVALHCQRGAAVAGGEEKLIGWKGETYSVEDGKTTPEPWVEHVAWHPRVFIHHNFLSPSEARHLRSVAALKMKRSSVVGPNGTSVLDPIRTSYGTFIRRKQDPIVQQIAERVALWTQLPPVHQEDMQVLRYAVGQKYGAHMDSLIDSSPRMATVLIYLADTEEGGETAFPEGSKWVSEEVAKRARNLSQCAAGKVAFRPRLGDAMLFFSIRPDGTHEPACMHTGCPVVKGHKWTATVWVHSQPFRPESYDAAGEVREQPPDPGQCKDLNERCATWVMKGECERNPLFMSGETGTCRAGCKVCTPCTDNDQACYDKNREAAGYLVYSKETML